MRNIFAFRCFSQFFFFIRVRFRVRFRVVMVGVICRGFDGGFLGVIRRVGEIQVDGEIFLGFRNLLFFFFIGCWFVCLVGELFVGWSRVWRGRRRFILGFGVTVGGSEFYFKFSEALVGTVVRFLCLNGFQVRVGRVCSRQQR